MSPGQALRKPRIIHCRLIPSRLETYLIFTMSFCSGFFLISESFKFLPFSLSTIEPTADQLPESLQGQGDTTINSGAREHHYLATHCAGSLCAKPT